MHKFLQAGKSLLLILLSLFVWTQHAFGQHITGLITDREGNEPVKYARVEVLNSSAEVATDKHGYFIIKGLKTQKWYTLRIAHAAFQVLEQDVYLAYDETTEVNVCLKRKLQDAKKEWINHADGKTEKWFESPVSVDGRNSQELAQNAPLSSLQALQGLSGVWLQANSPYGAAPNIRGLTGNRNLVLIDGIRLNTPLLHTYTNSMLPLVDPFSLERVEVIRSSASSLYGEGAMGGVVNLLSQSPSFTSQGIQVHGIWQSNFLSNEMELGGNLQIHLSTPHIAIKGNMSYGDFGNILPGGNQSHLIPSAFRRRYGDMKASIKLSANQKLTFAHRYSQLEGVSHYEKITFEGYAHFESDPIKHQMTYARWESYSNNRWFKKIQLTGSLQQLTEDRESYALETDFEQIDQDELNSWGASLKIHSQPFAQWNIVSGIDYYQDVIESQTYREGVLGNIQALVNTRFPDGAQANNLSVFSLHTLDILKLHLAFGGRAHLYQSSHTDPQFKEISISPRAISSNFSALYPLSRQYHMVASLNSGYRMPNFYDLSYLGNFAEGIEVPNETLGPEKSLTTEIGIKAQTNKYTGSIVLYRTRMSDLMRRVYSTYQADPFYMGQRVFMRQNLGEAFVRGIEAELSVPLSQRLLVYGNVNYTYGEEVNTGNSLSYIPPLHGKAGVRYQDKKGFWGKAEWFYAADQQELGNEDLRNPFTPNDGSPSWQVMNVFVGYDVGYDFGWCSASIGVLNAFNSSYRPHGSALDGYGRSVRASLRLKF